MCSSDLKYRPFLSVALVYVNVGHVYFACVQYRSNTIPIKGALLASHFTHCSSRCSFYSFSITCFRVPLSTQALSQPSKTARWREITAITLGIAEQFGISFGAVWLRFSLALGWPCTPMFLARRSGKRTVGLKDIFRIRFFHSSSIAFHYLSVHYLCPSMC